MQNKSESITELMVAFIKAKQEFKQLNFDKQGGRVNKDGSRIGYASIKAIKKATEEALHKYDLTCTQLENYSETHVSLITTITHSVSGQFISSFRKILINTDSKGIQDLNQQYGSALSYARRYSLQTILGLYGEEMDPDNPVSPNEIRILNDLINKDENSKELTNKILKHYKIDNFDQLYFYEYEQIIERLKKD